MTLNYQVPSFLEIVENSVKDNWDRPALSDWRGVSYSYADVAQKIARFHILFAEASVQKGDRIALMSRNCADWAIAFFAILAYGAVVVPILHEFKPHQAHHIVNHSGAKLFLVGDGMWDNLDENEMTHCHAFIALNTSKIYHCRKGKMEKVLAGLDEAFAKKYPEFGPNDVVYHRDQAEDLAIINYTSGTTSASKGVMLPFRTLWSNMEFAREVIPIEPGEHMVCMLPMAHMYGLAFEVIYEFCSGAHVFFLTRMPAPKILLQVFAEVKPVLVIAVPLIIEKIIRKNVMPKLETPTMKFLRKVPIVNKIIRNKVRTALMSVFGGNFTQVIVGGAALNGDVETVLKWLGFPYTVGYGMTECGPIISYQDHRKFVQNSCGVAAPRMELKIDSPDPVNVVGEICTRGCNVMLGYYDNQEATAAAIDAEGWLHTGDLGVMDAQGNLYIKGRSKNMLLGPSGQNIYPEELEEKWLSMPLVQECIVIQLENHTLAALVYPDMDECQKRNMSSDDIAKFMEKNCVEANKFLPAYAQIARVKVYREEFEKTPKKSIKRFLYQDVAVH